MLIHKSIRLTHIGNTIHPGHNKITVQIHDNTYFPWPVQITSIYVSPRSNKNRHTFQTDLLHTALNHKHAILMGDLNAHHTDLGCKTTNAQGKLLQTFIQNNQYIIINDPSQPTFTHTAHNFSDTLDYFITTPSILPHIQEITHDTDIGSDHIPLSLLITKKTNNRQDTQTQANTFNFRKTDWAIFSTALQEQTVTDEQIWPPTPIESHTDLDIRTNKIITHLQIAIEKSTPKHRTPNSNQPRLPSEILILIKTRRTLKARQLKHPQDHIRTTINQLNKQIKKAIKNTKRDIANNKAQILKTGPKHGQFWQTVKALLKTPTPTQYPIKQNNNTLTTPQDKLNAFYIHFKSIFSYTDDPTFDQNFTNTVHNQIPNIQPIAANTQDTPETHLLTRPITQHELQNTLKKANKNKAPGPDLIRYEHIQNAPDAIQTYLLLIFNYIIQTAYFPKAFKTAQITIIPKPNKDLTQITSYRPITLAPTLSKVLEHIINRRLLTFSIQNTLLKEHQTAFLPNKSTCDNILNATQTIIDNFNINNYTLALSLDIQQAFDRTWHAGIIHTLQPHVPIHFLRIILSFLTNRIITLKFENTIHTINSTYTRPTSRFTSITITFQHTHGNSTKHKYKRNSNT